MYTNIYEALRSGRTSEDLVKDFTDAMNEAEERVRREDEEAAAAEAAKTTANEKRTAFATAIKGTFDAISTYYPQFNHEDSEELTEEDYLGLADLVISLLDLEAVKYSVKPRVVKKKKPVARSSDDVFADFFKSIGF